ncbi:hypothetical protein [Pseudomonas sp. LT1P18]|uniref:hypothetical protein n=1 Tax=Pseudomonas arabinosi TaxID=3398357 RepID=UPI0039F09087
MDDQDLDMDDEMEVDRPCANDDGAVGSVERLTDGGRKWYCTDCDLEGRYN